MGTTSILPPSNVQNLIASILHHSLPEYLRKAHPQTGFDSGCHPLVGCFNTSNATTPIFNDKVDVPTLAYSLNFFDVIPVDYLLAFTYPQLY
ncbi:MAG: hypothetical protein KI790_00120 [Cyclobacteriaceae bacterium]|nr:hypothetical protein [Cyclobacteriaceae bacterium HetDA_MAG_MS6]